MPVEKVSITLMPDVREEVARRGENRSRAINESLARYYALLARARAAMRPMFRTGEQALLADVLKDPVWQPATIRLLPAVVEGAIRVDHADEKWTVDGEALLAKLRALDPISLVALVDGVEQFWASPNREHNRVWSEILPD